MCTGSCSAPRQGLPGDRQGPPWFLWSHSRTKYSSQGDKAPARGACREGQPRHLKELAVTRHASRRDPVSDKLPERQDNDRGKALAAASYHSVPALQHIHQRVALGPFQARMAGGCAASGARWQVALTRLPSWQAVASLTGPFFALFGRRRRAFNAFVPCRQG